MTSRRARFALPLLLLALGAGLPACEPTPEYIERYANTEDSEARFADYIKDPKVSQAVRVRALELLFDQWQYSSSMFVSGRVVRDIPDAELRQQTLRDFLPFLRTRFAAEATEIQARDAAFHLRSATDNREIRGQYAELLVEWLTTKWEPCRERPGALPPSMILSAVPAESVVPTLVERIRTGEIPDVECQRRAMEREVEWVFGNEALATAWMERWNGANGRLVENNQLNFTLFEHITRYIEQPAVRDWLFAMLANPESDPLYTNAALEVVSARPADGDLDRFAGLLGAPRNIRWAAFKKIIEAEGSSGLRRALSAMPAQSDYRYYDGEMVDNGFELAARNVVCAIPRLEELRDNARQQFEAFIRSDNTPARLLSIVCLERFGDAQTVTNLTTVLTELGPEPVAAPGFGEASLQDVITATITRIQARLAPPAP